MIHSSIKRAIVLAAGTGSRLSGALPKPLRSVAGVPLLVRVLRTLQAGGIREAVVVVGFEAERVRRALLGEPSLCLKLSFVENQAFGKKNGVSLLAAARFVDQPCLLTMADHLYSPELVKQLLAAALPKNANALAVDYDVERCFDLDDATKVRASAGRIAEIGKEIEHYDAIDTGVFRITKTLIRELETLHAQNGDCSLSEGVQRLARSGTFYACDVGDVRWIDVDTVEALERAEAMIRVFGESLGDEPGTGPQPLIDPEAIELFSPSWVRAAEPYNEDHFAIANRQTDVARLMANELPFAPSPRVLAAVMDAASRGHLYPGAARELKVKLGAREGYSENYVLLGAGSTELIDVVIRSFVAPGEEVLLSVPTFSMYEARARTVGGIPVLVPMNGEHEHDLAGIIRSVTERTKVIFLCSPNNPTGNRIDDADVQRILRLGLPTVIDEAYLEFGSGLTLAERIRQFPNLLVLRTFSKALGLAGMRVGYVLAHPAVIRLLSRVKVPWNLPDITLAAACAALDDQAELEARLGELKSAREQLVAGLSRMPGLVVAQSEGNFILVDISATGTSAEDFVTSLLSHGVLIRSLSVHHAMRKYVRVTVGTREQNARLLSALEPVLTARSDGVKSELPYFAIGDAE